MIVSELTAYLSEHKRAALIDLSNRLGSDPEALRAMLSMLERKGRVRKMPAGTACGGGCAKCEPASVELYEWVGAEAGAGPR
jgi:hypothetical protein